MECSFFAVKDAPVKKLIGEFAIERLTAFGKHASGSFLAFYSKSESKKADEVPVSWLDSEASPCIVISKNFKEFLSILPYGMGFAYTVASVIENNLQATDLLTKARTRVGATTDELIADAQQRFLDLGEVLQWLQSNGISLSKDPIKLIVDAHTANDDLPTWIDQNI